MVDGAVSLEQGPARLTFGNHAGSIKAKQIIPHVAGRKGVRMTLPPPPPSGNMLLYGPRICGSDLSMQLLSSSEQAPGPL